MMVAEAQEAHKDAREKRSSLASQQRPISLSDCPQSLMDGDIDVVPERLLRISWAFSRMSGNWSPICRRVVQVVRLVHHWFTTGTLWFASGSTGSLWFAGGSSGSRLVRVVHRWFKWFTTGSRSSGVVDVVRAHNLMGSV